ncbi:hypothetical protein [Desulfurivibrio alkaliphilus]|uniref:DUF507 family protein n=1 Tax=Desulfurivibrio alkaliphilus (strain DSM 19089 / UNIQEM U267 / AHT2) TaxID=589865 RepID=D6Z2Z1_DESAT|nr:hypothetical protein [Desulfurivibrio alkaliphilus]ADH85916.1 conserved hypothetical protein [Desulfurivibrio alkaliphilus AHT 2]
MGSQTRPFNDKTAGAIDRKRERERQQMLQNLYRHAPELATKLVQRLLDKHIIETNSAEAIREVFTNLFQRLPDMEDFDIQYKTAPLRGLISNPNFISLYVTQYIAEDLLEHDKIQDVYGEDRDIYQAVDSVLGALRPPS